MTEPVILYGTQSNGETLPVQVDATGRLVAEGLQGPPGEPGQPGSEGPPGPNVLLPYGEENSYLVIENGVPTWTLNPPTPPGPEPTYDVMLVDNREVPRSDIYDFGVYDDQQNLVVPPDPWDQACRSLPVFSDPTEKRSGIGGRGAEGKGLCSYSLKFNISEALGKVLQLTFVARMAVTYSSAWSTYYSEVSTEDTNFQPIKVQDEFYINQSTTQKVVFSYLINRPDFTDAEFTFTTRIRQGSYGYPDWSVLQRWEVIDSSTYLMQRMLAARNSGVSSTDLVDEIQQGIAK